MIYKQFGDIKLSALGLGMMRLPQKDKVETNVDEAAAAEMIEYAIQHGVNYFDTAWGYHGGESENVAGRLLSAYPRDKFYLATKFPGYDRNNFPKVREIFEKQLEKCKVDYFDFYLFHNVCEINIDQYLDAQYGVYEFLMEQKSRGRIKHLGVSMHGEIPVMKRFLEAYGKDMEFCQLQLNWLDWEFQHAREKVDLVDSYGIPVWVMEPVRGGRLASLAPEHSARLRALRPDESDVGWAFRFIQSVPQVTMTLSGMSDMAQLKQNIEIFSEDKPLNSSERAVLDEIASEMLAKKTLPCTACRYCTSHCPKGIDIPEIIRLYNEHIFTGGGFLAPMGTSAIPKDKRPSACIACKSCEAVCPQQIKISDMMAEFVAKIKK